jgi:hypothetical protein
MKTPIHLKRRGDNYFHLNPLYAQFSLIASFVLAQVHVCLNGLVRMSGFPMQLPCRRFVGLLRELSAIVRRSRIGDQ